LINNSEKLTWDDTPGAKREKCLWPQNSIDVRYDLLVEAWL
jgi:hypothetical protein